MPLIACLDIEASGFGRGSYPIEIGYVLADGSSYCTLVRPEPGWLHWDADAGYKHGLDRALLLQEGRDAHEVARRLNADLAGTVVYSDGWAHDYAWLGCLFESAGCAPAFRLGHIRSLLTETQAERWYRAYGEAAREAAFPRHRASNDARLVQLAFERVLADDALPPSPPKLPPTFPISAA